MIFYIDSKQNFFSAGAEDRFYWTSVAKQLFTIYHPISLRMQISSQSRRNRLDGTVRQTSPPLGLLQIKRYHLQNILVQVTYPAVGAETGVCSRDENFNVKAVHVIFSPIIYYKSYALCTSDPCHLESTNCHKFSLSKSTD